MTGVDPILSKGLNLMAVPQLVIAPDSGRLPLSSRVHELGNRGDDTSRLTEGGAIHVCVISPLGSELYGSELQCSGGAEFQLFLLANTLAADAQYRVSVLTTVKDGEGTEQVGRVVLIKRQARGRLNATSWGLALKTLWGYVAAFLEMFSLFRSINADVFVHASAGVEVGAYALICRLLRRRFVFVVASSADLCEPYGKVTSPLRWLYPLGVRYAHAVVCRSVEQQRWLQLNFHREGILIKAAHAERRPNCIDQPPREREALLWVGRITSLKRPQLFLDVVRRYPNTPCIMVVMKDNGSPELWFDVRTQAAALPNLRLHENVAWHQMDVFFEQATALVCTSEYEGFPNTFVQAAMAGTPILSYSVDPDGVLARHQIGMCAEGSFDLLLQSVQQLLSSKVLRDEYGRRGYAYAIKHHRLSESVGRFKQVVRTLLRKNADVRYSRNGA